MPEPPPPSLPPKELPINRFKFIWRVLMISNLALGAYMFVGARKRDIDMVNRKAVKKGVKNHKAVVEVPSAPTTTTDSTKTTPDSTTTTPDSTTTTPASPTTTTTSETWDM